MTLIKLKYLCSSFSTPITQDEIKEVGTYPVFGAGGLVGFKEEYMCEKPYLGIIKDGAGVGRISKYSEKSSLLGTMAYIIPNKLSDINWLMYVIMSLDLGKEISSTTIPHIYFKDYGNKYVLLPSVSEQQHIANFLDTECARIDAVIEKTRASIEEYKKMEQLVITQAVTKGIRPKRVMQESSIDWIGKYPSDWICEKVKYVAAISRGLFNHRPRNDERYYDGPYPFIQTGDVAQATKYITSYSQTLNELGKSVSKEFPKGTLTMTIAANVGDVAILGFDAYFPDSVVGFVPKEGIDGLYLYYIFSAMKEEFVRTAIKSTQLNLNIDRVKELFIPVTFDIHEQKEIVDYLEKKCSEIDELISKKKLIVNELEKYKKALIFEYVTGKKEVPA